jgi:2-methylisocitrate lyase-like PEP mutase family enzyme
MSFRQLHYADEPLLLPNAWDVSSALAFHDAGYRAIGTTSFGVAASAGHPDAEDRARS